MKTFVPRLHENGRTCCENPIALCAACKAHHARQRLASSIDDFAPPDPYAPRDLAAMSSTEHEQLGCYAAGVAAMRSAYGHR